MSGKKELAKVALVIYLGWAFIIILTNIGEPLRTCGEVYKVTDLFWILVLLGWPAFLGYTIGKEK